ncbi:MAG: hypothetical protein ACFHWX_00235 [Bacteroidota bacterium]
MKHTSLLLLALIIALAVRAQIPETISFQGNLTDPLTGNTIADGNYNLFFELLDDPTAGNTLWTEDQGSIPVSNGIFNVALGSISSFDPSVFTQPLWLEITVNGEILSPRIEIGSSAYSLASKALIGDNFIPNSGNVHIGGNLNVGGVAPTIDLAIDDDDTGLEVSTDGILSFYTNGIEHMALSDAGALNISGTFSVSNASGEFSMHPTFGEGPNQSSLIGTFSGSSLYPQMRFVNDTSSGFVDIGLINGNQFVIENSLDEPLLNISQSGNFGIGTSPSSQYKFNLNNGVGGPNWNLYLNNDYDGSSYSVGIANMLYGTNTGFKYGYYSEIENNGTSGTMGIYVYQYGSTTETKYGLYMEGEDVNYFEGSVGVGTTTPAEKLSVNGNIASNGTVTADMFSYNSPKVSYYSVPPSQYELAGGGTDATYYLSPSYYASSITGGTVGSAAYIIAPVNQPHNARITHIDFYYSDTDATYDIQAYFYGVPHGTSSVALAPTITTSSGTPGNTFGGVDLNHVVDNSANHYWIYVVTRQATSALQIKSTVITYELTDL